MLGKIIRWFKHVDYRIKNNLEFKYGKYKGNPVKLVLFDIPDILMCLVVVITIVVGRP
jgi:hypothetical protein